MVTRALRPRGKSVDYRSAGLGASDQPGWLKVGQSPSVIQSTGSKRHGRKTRSKSAGAENANPQLATKQAEHIQPGKVASSGKSAKAPAAATSPAKMVMTSDGKTTKSASSRQPVRSEDKSGTKRKLRLSPASPPTTTELAGNRPGKRLSARKSGEKVKAASPLAQSERPQPSRDPRKQPAKDRSAHSGNRKQGETADERMQKAAAKEVIEISDAEDFDKSAAAETLTTMQTTQRPATTTAAQNKPTAADKAQPSVGSEKMDVAVASACAQIASGGSQEKRISSNIDIAQPQAAPQLAAASAAARMAAAVAAPLPLPAPPVVAAQPSMAAFVRLQEAHLALQDKYRMLKEGKLTELEKSLKVSCSSLDDHLKMANELAGHWKAEAEHQAKLAQSVAAKEFHEELQRLKMQCASQGRARLEAEEQIQTLNIKCLELQHQLHTAESAATEAKELLQQNVQSYADAEVQTEALPGSPFFGGSSKGSLEDPKGVEKEAVCSTKADDPSATDVCHSRTEATAEGSPSLQPPSPLCTPAAADGMASACGDDEEEIIVLEIRINEPGAPSCPQVFSTPCSVVKRMARSGDMRRSCSGGPVRVVVVGPDGQSLGGSSANAATPGPTFPLLPEVVPSDDSLFVVSSRKRKMATSEDAPEPKCRLQLDPVEERAASGTAGPFPEAALCSEQPPQVEDNDHTMPEAAVEPDTGHATTTDIEWTPVQLLTQFTREAGTAPGFVSFLHSVTGFKFEIGPDDEPSSDSETIDAVQLKFRPLALGRADLPEHFKEELSFTDDQKSNLFFAILDFLSK